MANPLTQTREADKPAGALFQPDPYRPDGAWSLDLTVPRCPDLDRPVGWKLDAKLWEGRFADGHLLEHRVQHYGSREKVQRQHRRLKEAGRRAGLRELDSLDWWSYGAGQAIPTAATAESPLTQQFVPLLPGPATRQLYWADYFAMSAKAFEAYQHDPLAHRAVEITIEFTLGRGIEGKCPNSEPAQKAWDDFWALNDMDERLRRIVRSVGALGETFVRYFPLQQGLVVRELDPATIYEIVTDQEDVESVFFYHQQYTTRYQLYSPPSGNIAPQGRTEPGVTKYIVRQIPAEEIDHVRVNSVAGEARGRSDLFPALGYIKRFRDLMTSRVVKADMEARMVWKGKVDGNQGDVQAFRRQVMPNNSPPAPGSMLVVNNAADLEAMQFSGSGDSQSATGDVDALINLIAVAVGVPKEYLGIQGRGSRATALVATEPAAKRFEDRQRLVEQLLHRMAERVFDYAKIPEGDARVIEFTFPSIASEDRSSKLKDIAFAEANGYISKETAATVTAKELGMTTYDFDDEQKAIAAEFDAADDTDGDGPAQGDGKIRRPMLMAQYRQAPKLDPTKAQGGSEDEPPGLLTPVGSGSEDEPAGQTTAGFPQDENPMSGKGAANIRQDQRMGEAERLLAVAVREAVRAARAPRRRPDDPDFKRASEEYRQASRENLAEVANGVKP